jgi:hypothetical protein
MEVNLLYASIISILITICLYFNSSKHDKLLLLIMIIGQFILFFGEYNKSNKKIQVAHILFVLTIIIGSVYFKGIHNLYFLIVAILLYFITNIIYKGCLFRISNNNYKFKVEQLWSNINWDIVFFILLIILCYRIFKINK